MNRHMIVLVLSLLSIASGCETMGMKNSSASSSSSKESDAMSVQSDVRMKTREYTTALANSDMPALEKLWADNLVFINGRGMMQTKQQRLADIRSGATVVQSVDISDESIRCSDDGKLAAEFCVSTIKGKYNGQDASGDYRTTIAWVKRGNAWQIVLIQLTPMIGK